MTRALLLCLAPVAAALLPACNSAPPSQPLPQPVVVESPQPLQGPGGVDAYPGTVHARVEADLAFRVGGKIAERRVDLGSRIAPGQVLAVLDPGDAQLNLDAARAALSAAEADLWLAREEQQRFAELRAKGHVGQSALDQRLNVTRLAEARLQQARSQLDLARNQSRYTRLKADAAGVVTQVIGEAGNVVAAGQPVIRVALDGEREIRIAVPEGRVGALRKAAGIGVELFSRPGAPYGARIRDISPQADPATRTHEARVTVLDPDEHVQLGATATVMLAAAAGGRTFRLPATAVGTLAGDQPGVWVVVEDPDGATRVRPRPVQVLQYLEQSVIVSGELGAEDRLVSAGIHRLVEGMAVRPIDRAAKAAL